MERLSPGIQRVVFHTLSGALIVRRNGARFIMDFVVDLLIKDGYNVRAFPNTLRSLTADAAVISTYLKTVDGPVILVGHSYGGSVISVASADAPSVKALVYVDAFAPDVRESANRSSRAHHRRRRISHSAYRCRRRKEPATNSTSTRNTSQAYSPRPNRRMSRHILPPRSGRSRSLLSRIKPDAVGWKTIRSRYVIGDADKVIPPDIQLIRAITPLVWEHINPCGRYDLDMESRLAI